MDFRAILMGLATPLLAVLSEAFPDARFDWAVSDWARPAIVGNPRLTELISTGEGDIQKRSWRQIGHLVKRLRMEKYDTCFMPSRSGVLSYIAWQAGIRFFKASYSIRLDACGQGNRNAL